MNTLHAVELENLVVGARLRVELELIAQARAAAAQHAQTQAARARPRAAKASRILSTALGVTRQPILRLRRDLKPLASSFAVTCFFL